MHLVTQIVIYSLLIPKLVQPFTQASPIPITSLILKPMSLLLLLLRRIRSPIRRLQLLP
jgi:hypothetical protein